MRTALLGIILAGITSAASAQDSTRTWEGYLADQMCAFRWRGQLAETYARRHQRSCNFDEACMASGYGVMVRGTFVKLTDSSAPIAIRFLESTKKKSANFVKVTGVMDGEKIRAATIEEATEPPAPSD